MANYPDILSGAQGLLYEVATILNDHKVQYIIVGGWSPYLLNNGPIKHPGTKDVDILFDKGYNRESLRDIITVFLEKGFILSAKHDFQLFKIIRVEGRDFIYNIDLLHPLETKQAKDIYIEQIDLAIPSNKYRASTFTIKSIALPMSQGLFDCELYEHYELVPEGVKGQSESVVFPLMNDIGTLITKAGSVLVEKRYRDAFDIYITISQNKNYAHLIEKITELKDKSRVLYNSLYPIKESFDTGMLINNIYRFANPNLKEVKELYHRFFIETGLDQPAED